MAPQSGHGDNASLKIGIRDNHPELKPNKKSLFTAKKDY